MLQNNKLGYRKGVTFSNCNLCCLALAYVGFDIFFVITDFFITSFYKLFFTHICFTHLHKFAHFNKQILFLMSFSYAARDNYGREYESSIFPTTLCFN